MDKICSKYVNRGYRVVHGRGNNQILFLEVASSFLWVFNMSATMARQGGWVQLEQSDMHLALNMAKMAKGGFSTGAIEEMQYLIKFPCATVRDEKWWGVEFPRHRMVKAAIERHLYNAKTHHMLREKSYSKCHHHTQESPTKPCWKVKECNQLHHPGKNRIKPPAKDKYHISTFFRLSSGHSYYTNQTHFRYWCWGDQSHNMKLNLIAAKGRFGTVG